MAELKTSTNINKSAEEVAATAERSSANIESQHLSRGNHLRSGSDAGWPDEPD